MQDTCKSSSPVENTPPVPVPETPDSQPLQTKDIFIASLTHELKSQLSGITWACRYLDKEDNRDFYIKLVTFGCDNTFRVLENMLTTVKYQGGKLVMEAQNETFHFSNWFTPFLEPFQANPIYRSKINLTTYLDLQNELITTDKVKLGQILTNLLTNALKHSYQQHCITINASMQRDHLTIHITNEGNTIPPDKIGNLFEPYYQISNGFAGVGLGLFLSQLYAKTLGGSITVQSENESTTFTVSIPLCILHS